MTHVEVAGYLARSLGIGRLRLLLAAVFATSALDMVGVTIIFPYLALVMDEDRHAALCERLPGHLSTEQMLAAVGAALMLLYAAKALTHALLSRWQHQQMARFSAVMTDKIVDLMLSARYAFFQQVAGSEIAGVAYHHPIHAALALRALLQIASEATFLLLFLITALVFYPLLTLGALGGLVAVGAVVYLLAIRRTSALGRRQADIENHRYRLLHAIAASKRDINVMGLGPLFSQKNRAISEDFANVAWRFSFNGALPLQIIELTVVIGFLCAVMWMVHLRGELAGHIPLLGAVAVGVIRAVPALAKLSMGVNAFRFSKPLVERLMRMASQLAEQTHLRVDDKLDFSRSFEARDLRFDYGNAATLRNVSISLPKNATVAVVGPSGSGKTTLLDVVTGLQPVLSGEFRLDGQVFNPYSSKSFRDRIGYVPQNISLLDESIEYNITLSPTPDATRLASAVDGAGLADVIARLPEGLATRVGENGIRLSGGQRQRVAIARALYRAPDILVFDEPTSALDALAEREFGRQLARLAGRVTMLLVTHKISAAAACDRIYVMNHGRIVGEGNHRTLLGECELYREMQALQNALNEPLDVREEA